MARIKANVGAFEFASLDQQQPRPAEGGFFDEANFKVVDYVPEGLQWFRYVDLALGKTQTADWNTAVATALDASTGIVYFRDMLRVHELDDFMRQAKSWMLSDAEKGTIWGFENVAFQSLVMKDFLKDATLANVAIIPITPDGDKVTRARPLQTRARQGLVCLKRGAWTQPFINEATEFPNGKHDDQVDTASGGMEMVASEGPGWAAWAREQLEKILAQTQAQTIVQSPQEIVNGA